MTRRRLTPSQKAAILERQAWTCGCGKGCDLRGQAVEYDHMIPLALGGADSLENLQALLVSCHRGAGGKTAADMKRIAKAKRMEAAHKTGRSRVRRGAPLNSIQRLPSTGYLRDLFDYCAERGSLIAKKARGKIKVGDEVGSTRADGYQAVMVEGRTYLMHRLVWAWHGHKLSEKCLLDHIDGDPSNNRIENLRPATISQNNANSRNRTATKRGLPRGVGYNPAGKSKPYRASLRVGGKERHLGYFDCPAAAHLRYLEEADKVFGEFARHAHETGRSRARKGPAMRSRGFTGWRKFNGEVVRGNADQA